MKLDLRLALLATSLVLGTLSTGCTKRTILAFDDHGARQIRIQRLDLADMLPQLGIVAQLLLHLRFNDVDPKRDDADNAAAAHQHQKSTAAQQ